MKCLLFTKLLFPALVCLYPAMSAMSEAITFSTPIRATIGSLQLAFDCTVVQPGGMVELEIGNLPEGSAVAVRAVIADEPTGKQIWFDAKANGRLVMQVQQNTEGFGRRTYFLNADSISQNKNVTLEVTNTGSQPLYLETPVVIKDYQKRISASLSDNDFTLAFLINHVKPGHADLARITSYKKAAGVRYALSSEVPFAMPDFGSVEARIKDFADAAESINWPAIPIMISWWAGTPPEIRQRLDFQQVCYSETDTLDEGQGLKDLLGDKWDIRYGLTIPNIWSNTPWQTMNNPELNQLRKDRLLRTMPLVKKHLGGRILSYITENEPMYWAGEFPDQNYPVKREGLLADFNPHTVAAAAKDGVTLDPKNGLGFEERKWLSSNLHNYLKETSDWIASASDGKTVYTHALLEDHYPTKGTGVARPAMEAAVSPGHVTGVEMLWDTNLDKLLRLREWGRWGLVNREEGDSRPIIQHIAMAVMTYAMGSELLNAYNWNGIRPEDAETYFNGFADSLPVRVIAENQGEGTAQTVNSLTFNAGADPAFPWGNRLLIKGICDNPENLTLTVIATDEKRVTAFKRGAINKDGYIRFDLDSLTDARQHRDLRFEVRGAAMQIFTDSDKPVFQWILNAATERQRSRIIQSGM